MHTASCRQELTQAHLASLASSCSSSRRPATQHAGMQQFQTGPCHTPAQSSQNTLLAGPQPHRHAYSSGHPSPISHSTSAWLGKDASQFPNSASDWGRISHSNLLLHPWKIRDGFGRSHHLAQAALPQQPPQHGAQRGHRPALHPDRVLAAGRRAAHAPGHRRPAGSCARACKASWDISQPCWRAAQVLVCTCWWPWLCGAGL